MKQEISYNTGYDKHKEIQHCTCYDTIRSETKQNTINYKERDTVFDYNTHIQKHILCSITIHMKSILLPNGATERYTCEHHKTLMKRRTPNTCDAMQQAAEEMPHTL